MVKEEHHDIVCADLSLILFFSGALQTAFPDSDLHIAEDALQKWLKDAKWRKQMPQSALAASSSNSTQASNSNMQYEYDDQEEEDDDDDNYNQPPTFFARYGKRGKGKGKGKPRQPGAGA